jgi:hypothetical protein
MPARSGVGEDILIDCLNAAAGRRTSGTAAPFCQIAW